MTARRPEEPDGGRRSCDGSGAGNHGSSAGVDRRASRSRDRLRASYAFEPPWNTRRLTQGRWRRGAEHDRAAAATAAADEDWSLTVETEPETADCASAAQLAQDVRAHTGRELVLDREDTAYALHATLARDPQGLLVLTLALRDARGELIGERTLARPEADCTALREAATLAIVVMMGTPEPEAAKATALALAEAPAVAPPDPERPPAFARAPAAAVEREDSEPLHLSVGAGGAGSFGMLPGPALHASLGARFTGVPVGPLELALVFLGQSRAELDAVSNGYVRFVPTYGVLAACPLGLRASAARQLRMDVCLGVIGGYLSAETHAFTLTNLRVSQLLAGVVARVPVALQLEGPVWFIAAASLGTQLVYQKYVAIDAGFEQYELARTGGVFGSLELQLAAELF